MCYAARTAALTPARPVQGEPWKIVGFSIYGACLMALFACSTLHHGLEGHEGMEKGLRIADFCAIFPLIAGAWRSSKGRAHQRRCSCVSAERRH